MIIIAMDNAAGGSITFGNVGDSHQLTDARIDETVAILKKWMKCDNVALVAAVSTEELAG